MEFHDELNISPVAEEFELLAEDVYEIIDGYWEEAPVNNKLKDFMSLPHDETDFYKVRFKIDWLVLNSYLFYYYGKECNKKKLDMYEEYQDEEEINSQADFKNQQ